MLTGYMAATEHGETQRILGVPFSSDIHSSHFSLKAKKEKACSSHPSETYSKIRTNIYIKVELVEHAKAMRKSY